MVLVPCPSCARHVDVSETGCPFCECALPADLRSRVIPGTTRRLSRAAMFTFATTVTVLGAVASCDNGNEMTSYGAAISDDSDSSYDSGGVQALYGLSGEAGIEEDAAPDASDASFIDDSGDAGEGGD